MPRTSTAVIARSREHRSRVAPRLRWALVVLLTLTATLAGGSAASAQGGEGRVQVPVDQPTSRSLSARWPAVPGSPDFVVSRSTASVQIVLPPEVDDIGPAAVGATARVLRDGANFPETRVDLTDGVVTVPLADYLAAQAPVVPSTVDVVVRPENAWDPLYLVVRLTLTSDPGPSHVTLDLSLDGAGGVSDRYNYALDGLVAGAGTRVTVDAAPGFWNEPGTTSIDVSTKFVLDGRHDEWWQLPYSVSPDGSRLTFTLRDADVDYRSFAVDLYLNGLIRRSVAVWLVPPSTDPVEAYVESVYLDLFGRSPDPTGLANWSAALRTGTPYGQVANGITYSDEYRSGMIRDTYAEYLGREPDAGGAMFWLQHMQAGWQIEQMQGGFISSDEYYARGGGTDAGWIVLLYQNVLDRNPSSDEIGFWRGQLGAGSSRATVARGFLYSD
jgi:hypothetical protein